MTVLLTGGTGKTATALIPYLTASSIPYLITSRSQSTALHQVQFDFTDPSTYSAPFTTAVQNGSPVKAVYLVLPMQAPDCVKVTSNFIRYALEEQGVKRFVLLGASNVVKGGAGPHAGVWDSMSGLIEEGKIEATILKPTWFLENLSSFIHFKTIKEEGKIYSACEDGKAPWVAVDDISRVAYHALVSPTPLDKELLVLGPSLITVDEIAATLSKVLSRKIEHVRLSPEDRVQWIVKNIGFPEQGARHLVMLETTARDGREALMNDVVETVTGKKGWELEDWIRKNKAAWE